MFIQGVSRSENPATLHWEQYNSVRLHVILQIELFAKALTHRVQENSFNEVHLCMRGHMGLQLVCCEKGIVAQAACKCPHSCVGKGM